MKRRQHIKLPIQGYRKTDLDFPYEMQNLYFEMDKSIRIRPGLTLSNATSSASANNGTIAMLNFNGDKIWYNGSDLYKNGTVLKNYATGGRVAFMTEVFNNVYVAPDFSIASKVMAVVSPTGVWSETTATYDGTNKISPGIVCEHRGILFIGRSKEDGVLYKNRIRWSNYGNPQDFDPTGDGSYESYEDIGDDADEIMSLFSLGNELIVFKRRSIWVASGIASDIVAPDYIRQLTNEYGLVAPMAVTKYKGGLIFLSESGLVFTDGRTFKVIEDDMWRWCRPASTPSEASWQENSLAWSEKFRTLFFYNYTGDAVTAGLLAKSNGEWCKWDMGRALEYGDDIYIRMGATVGIGKLNELGNTNRFDTVGTAVSSVSTISPAYVTEWMDFGEPGTKKQARSVYINPKSRFQNTSVVYGFNIYQYVDENFSTAVWSATQTMNGGGATLIGEFDKIRLKITPASGGNDYFDIDDMTINVIKRGGR